MVKIVLKFPRWVFFKYERSETVILGCDKKWMTY